MSGESTPPGGARRCYNFSHRSADLLLEAGVSYDASLMGDDVPYLLQASRGTLLELPSHWAMDDWPPFMHSLDLNFLMPGIVPPPQRAWETWWDEFEAMWESGGLWVPVWHPFLSGRLARWRHTHAMIGRMLERGGVWFAPLRDIAAHVRRWPTAAGLHRAGRRATA